jgi:hypothetical protein
MPARIASMSSASVVAAERRQQSCDWNATFPNSTARTLWGLGLSNHERLRLLAANYRERAAETVNIEQRSRHLAFAEHCDRLAAAKAPRPKGMATRLAEALLRRATRFVQTAGAT